MVVAFQFFPWIPKDSLLIEEMKILLSSWEVISNLMFGSVNLPTQAVLSLSKNWGKPSYLPFICSEMTWERCQKHQEMKNLILLIENDVLSKVNYYI